MTYLNYKIFVIIVIVNVKSKLLLLQDNFKWREPQLKKKLKSISRGTQAAENKFLKPAVNVAAPIKGMAVGAKSKNPQVAQATTNILKRISVGKILSLTDMHGQGLRLKVR